MQYDNDNIVVKFDNGIILWELNQWSVFCISLERYKMHKRCQNLGGGGGNQVPRAYRIIDDATDPA